MRVCYLINSIGRAGAEVSLAAMAPRWAGAGVRLDVAYLYPREELKNEFLSAGARLALLGTEGGLLSESRRFRAILRKWRPDIVHATLFEADLISRLVRVTDRTPVVSSIVNSAYGPEQLAADPRLRRSRLKAAQTLDSLSARTVRRFHAISAAVKTLMGQRLHIRPSKIDVVPRGRDPGKLGEPSPERRADARRRLGVEDGDLLVFAGARQVPQKGLDVLLRAFAQLRDRQPLARLIIAGREGSHTTVLQRVHRELGLADSARFIGERNDIPDLLCGADVWVEPSRWEGGPGALLEAMALSSPIVASDLPVYEEAVSHLESALLVPPDEPNALANAIDDALTDRASSLARAAAARQRFHEAFTIDRVADQMLGFYGRALAA